MYSPRVLLEYNTHQAKYNIPRATFSFWASEYYNLICIYNAIGTKMVYSVLLMIYQFIRRSTLVSALNITLVKSHTYTEQFIDMFSIIDLKKGFRFIR